MFNTKAIKKLREEVDMLKRENDMLCAWIIDPELAPKILEDTSECSGVSPRLITFYEYIYSRKYKNDNPRT